MGVERGMRGYPISPDLMAAIERLYPREDTGKLALGFIGPPVAMRKPPADSRIPYTERIRELVRTLENWIDLNSRQLAEFEGEYDETRRKFEGRAMLLALREIHRLFPETFAETD